MKFCCGLSGHSSAGLGGQFDRARGHEDADEKVWNAGGREAERIVQRVLPPLQIDLAELFGRMKRREAPRHETLLYGPETSWASFLTREEMELCMQITDRHGLPSEAA
jgi:hypothetical protein